MAAGGVAAATRTLRDELNERLWCDGALDSLSRLGDSVVNADKLRGARGALLGSLNVMLLDAYNARDFDVLDTKIPEAASVAAGGVR